MAVITRIAVLILAVTGFGLVQAGTALADALPNDNFANATSISALPFSDSGDLNGATVEPGESPECGTAQTIWYAFTPATDVVLNGDVNGSDSGVVVNVYASAGTGLSGLSLLSCGSPGAFVAHAGTTYYFQVGDDDEQAGTANFQFHLQQIPPPANDDFANATPVSSIPFTDTVSHPIASTIEPGEPNRCSGGDQTGSVWWSFTPSASGPYTAGASFGGSLTSLAAYRGTSLADLTQVGCELLFSGLTFQATAGVTYFIRASGAWALALAMIPA